MRLSVALQSGKEFKPVAFVDDHHALHGSVINGIEVFSPSELPTIIPEFSIADRGCRALLKQGVVAATS